MIPSVDDSDFLKRVKGQLPTLKHVCADAFVERAHAATSTDRDVP